MKKMKTEQADSQSDMWKRCCDCGGIRIYPVSKSGDRVKRGVAFDWACCTGKEQQDILNNSDSYGHEKLQGEERLVQASWCPMF